MSSDLKRDMTSVWAVCGAVALRPASAVALLGTVVVYVWFRQQRPAGQPLHRKCFNAATALIGCLTAGYVVHAGQHVWGALPWSLSGSVSVIAAIVVYTTVNRGLVTLALTSVGVRGRVLLGSRDDNLIEIATLCLGGLVALAVLHVPWLAALVIAPMVTLQRGALVRELEMAATTDAKTGLLNAVAWEHVAQREISRARRDKYSVAVLIIDIDRFKLVNDRFGHLIGDTVLRGVGRCISDEVREYDSVGRFGGEEFVAVLPEVDDAAAMVVAERVRARVNDLRVSTLLDRVGEDDNDVLAVSIGVACWPADGDELSDVLHAADSALYRAKGTGRNRVELAERGSGDTFVPALG
jgi:diguanylate cyclase (GGDEF)-like protein